jgi:hypothetical protein
VKVWILRPEDYDLTHFDRSCDNRERTWAMDADDFRDLALSMEGAIERAHMGHPDFRVNGRIFATLHSNDQWGMVKVLPEEQRELMRTHPQVFVPSSGAWGRQGCTNVRLDSADPASVRGALLLAWQAAVAQPPSRPRRRAQTVKTVRSRKR